MLRLLSSIIQANLAEEMPIEQFDRLLTAFERDMKSDVKTFAKKTGMSISSFQRYCQKHWGKSPQKVRTEYRMKKAVNLLSGTDESIKGIASMLGYASASAFSKAYMHYCGHRPGEDRNPPGPALEKQKD